MEKDVRQLLRAVPIAQPLHRPLADGSPVRIAADSSIAAFEGDSSFATLTDQARQAANYTAASVGQPSAEVSTVLSELRHIVELHGNAARKHDTHLALNGSRQSSSQEDLPPIALSIALINSIKGQQHRDMSVRLVLIMMSRQAAIFLCSIRLA